MKKPIDPKQAELNVKEIAHAIRNDEAVTDQEEKEFMAMIVETIGAVFIGIWKELRRGGGTRR